MARAKRAGKLAVPPVGGTVSSTVLTLVVIPTIYGSVSVIANALRLRTIRI